MDSFFARNRLSAYLDGSLTDNEAAEVETALSEDEQLRGEYDEMRRAVELLRTVGPAEAPDGFHARLMARLDQEPEPGPVVSTWRRTLGRVPVEALALAAAAVIVVLVIQGRGDDPEPAVSSVPQVSIKDVEAPAPTDQPPPPQQAAAEDTRQASAPTGADGDLTTAAAKGQPDPLPQKQQDMRKSYRPAATGSSRSPDQPYYAGWEQQGADLPEAQLDSQHADNASTGDDLMNTGAAEMHQGIEMEGPRAFRISLADPDVLFQLSALAEKAGGRLTDAAGVTLHPRNLSAQDAWVQVHVVVPRPASDTIQRSVNALGGVATPPPPNNVLYSAEYAVFVVDVSASK